MTEIVTATTDVYAESVRILTAAAQRRQPNGEQADFADFLAQVLTATAANVGGPERLLAGRPGSWEAELVYSLVEGTMGDDPADWLRYRTEPLTIPLNVAELIETHLDHDGLLGLDDAIDGIHHQYALDEDPLSEPNLEALAHTVEAIEDRYRTEFRDYADQFAAAIHNEAERLGIPGAITVIYDADPGSRWWESPGIHNPDSLYASNADPIAAELWDQAHDATPLPNVDIAYSARLSMSTRPEGLESKTTWITEGAVPAMLRRQTPPDKRRAGVEHE